MIFLNILLYYLLKNVHFDKMYKINLEKMAKNAALGLKLIRFIQYTVHSI